MKLMIKFYLFYIISLNFDINYFLEFTEYCLWC